MLDCGGLRLACPPAPQDAILSTSPWAAAAGTSDNLESLLQQYSSPKHGTLSPLLSGDITKQGAGLYGSVHATQQDDISESIFNNSGSGMASAVGSAPHTPRGSHNNLFEALQVAVGSPRAGLEQRGSFTNQAAMGLGKVCDGFRAWVWTVAIDAAASRV